MNVKDAIVNRNRSFKIVGGKATDENRKGVLQDIGDDKPTVWLDGCSSTASIAGAWLTKAALAVLLVGVGVLNAADSDQAHALLDRTLKTHVRDGRVDYEALKRHRQDLDTYLATAAAVSKPTFQQWGETRQMAFLINVYNAATLQLIVDHYPVKSIKKIGSWLKGPWDQPVVLLWGGRLTLNDLEHKILRVRFKEPRIHFALVCAARGCPPLRSEAYAANRLDAQLDDQARRFLSNSRKNRVDARNRRIYLSPIFKWYGADFVQHHGNLLDALNPYWPEPDGSSVRKNFAIRYTDYDWTLNDIDR